MDSKSEAQGPPSREHSEYSFPGTEGKIPTQWKCLRQISLQLGPQQTWSWAGCEW